MDQVTFRSDTVLSDVHLLIPNARHLMTRLNSAGQPGESVRSHTVTCSHVKHMTPESQPSHLKRFVST
ncbi:methyltransferase-like protein 22 isoform X1 [Tachysurus ichikawai]